MRATARRVAARPLQALTQVRAFLVAGTVTAWLLVGCAQPAGVQAGREGAPASVSARHAWVQRTADAGWAVRALTGSGTCPSMQWATGRQALAVRARPTQVPARATGSGPDAKTSIFDTLSCEAAWPAGAAEVNVGGVVLKAPLQEPRRIVLIGDTGCRMKAADQAYQDCNDAQAWPFAAVARSAAALRPDLIVHLGDLHYRESPCPADRAGCQGSPWGYGDDAWRADFFEPAGSLLSAAPWLFVRGNHESCARAGVGWFRYVDARPWSTTDNCLDPRHDATADFTPPFAVPLSSHRQWIVFDSAGVSGRPYAAGSPGAKTYAQLLERVQVLAGMKPHSIFLNHHPVLGFAGSDSGAPRPGHAGLQSVMVASQPQRLFPAEVDLVIGGHFHVHEAVDFASDHPAALVVGNSGSAMEGRIDPARARRSEPAPGARVKHFHTHPGFGFATLEDEAGHWTFRIHAVDGRVLATCPWNGASLACSQGAAP